MRMVPQLPMGVAMVPDTAQETPGRTLRDFFFFPSGTPDLRPEPGFQCRLCLAFRKSQGPITAERLAHQDCPFSTPGQQERTWLLAGKLWRGSGFAERNSKVWPLQDGDWKGGQKET